MMQHCRCIVLAIFLLGLSSGWFAGRSRGSAERQLALAAARPPGATVRRQGNDLLVDLAKGQEIILRLPGEPLRFDEAAHGARQGDVSRIGLH
jgi:hypothetical protein